MSSRAENPAPLRLAIIDMNNGWPNQAIRCLHGLLDRLLVEVRTANPAIEATRAHVQPRNLGEAIPRDCDLYLSSGGPGAPFDGWDDPWCCGYRALLDGLVAEGLARGESARKALVICHSFEIATAHLAVARVTKRPVRRFGIQPAYMTDAGMTSPLLGMFGDRLFAWENRNFQATDVDAHRLAALGGEVWARESRDGKSKGEGVLAMRLAPGIEGVQFHPEADRRAIVAWLHGAEHKAATIAAFGDVTYQRMLKTLTDPKRLPRTLALVIPTWLARQFNVLAPSRGWKPIPAPVYGEQAAVEAFAAAVPEPGDDATGCEPRRRHSTPTDSARSNDTSPR